MISSKIEVKGAARKWGGGILEDFTGPCQDPWASENMAGFQQVERLGPAREIVPAEVMTQK